MIREDEPAIVFTDEDARQLHHPHDDAIVITLAIANYTTRRVLIHNEILADILYYPTFQQMRINKELLHPVNIPMIGFEGMKVIPEVNFLVVDCSSLYNAIIGRPTLNSWRAATSTYHLSVKFTIEYGIEEIQGDQLAARECYLAMLAMDEQMQKMNIEERRMLAKSIEVLEDVPLKASNPEKFTKIGTSMEEKTKQDLVRLIKRSMNVFSWSHVDMPEIDPSVITHLLNISPSYKPVRQKKRVFAPERDYAIKEEVHKLIIMEFICEVYYPDWLGNVVIVKKANGKWRMCVNFTDFNRACPKDSHPLLRIDQLVDATAGHQLLSFMDAFSGYNQIKMDEAD
ncbi:uncharacterized protein LOC142609095 [Castanea sativa]|uniref:uncharacterized protein LOC142609095 n=1 Tax=Castanea sativa TaxID=21020 RepID=UPI003F654279